VTYPGRNYKFKSSALYILIKLMYHSSKFCKKEKKSAPSINGKISSTGTAFLFINWQTLNEAVNKHPTKITRSSLSSFAGFLWKLKHEIFRFLRAPINFLIVKKKERNAF